MTITVSSAFDGGNIELMGQSRDCWELAIRRDHQSEFYQWFFFRVTGAAGVALVLRIGNAGGSAYPKGWTGYQARVSDDLDDWRLADTAFDGTALTIRHLPATDTVWFAYHAPYSTDRHHRLIARAAAAPGVGVRTLGVSLDGRPIDCIEMGDRGPVIWLYARQHPGETMAEWWMEGALDRLLDPADPVGRALRQCCRLHLVPNMNPDGSARGHLRTNAGGVNLNRVWHAPDPATEPEVACVLAAMDASGVDFAIDVHGDEALPHVFLAGFEGIPAATEQQRALYRRFETTLSFLSPDFQTEIGYDAAPPGRGNMTMSTNAVAHRFGCPAFTLEMPFKDALELPDPVRGWSPGRSKAMGRDCLAALLEMVDELG